MVELRAGGIDINDDNCSVLVRDACNEKYDDAGRTVLDGKRIKIVHVMKYLGIYISSDLDRRSTVSHLIKMAYKAFNMLNSFLNANGLPFELLINLYHSVILPVVLYGLKAATLTKRNRTSTIGW